MSPATFREVIRPPLWLIAFLYFMLFSLVLAIWAAFDNRTAVIAALIALVLGAIVIFLMQGEINCDGDELRVLKSADSRSRSGGTSRAFLLGF